MAPFIDLDNRAKFGKQPLAVELAGTEIPGNKCFLFYQRMIRAWKASPRWTTAHEIYKQLHNGNYMADDQAARELAWQVFFQLHVMPYEVKKRKENGEVE